MLSPYSQLRVLTILSMAIATMHLQVYSYVTRVGPSIYWLTATIHSLLCNWSRTIAIRLEKLNKMFSTECHANYTLSLQFNSYT